jgi:antitoxin MazE
MSRVFRARIVKIGNSRGIPIPRLLLEQTGITEEVELEVRGDAIVIRPVHGTRSGWAEALRQMAVRGDDQLLDAEASAGSSWDRHEWEW